MTYYVINKRGDLQTNTHSDGPNAVTWGVFPGKEIIQPTVVEAISFMAWKVLFVLRIVARLIRPIGRSLRTWSTVGQSLPPGFAFSHTDIRYNGDILLSKRCAQRFPRYKRDLSAFHQGRRRIPCFEGSRRPIYFQVEWKCHSALVFRLRLLILLIFPLWSSRSFICMFSPRVQPPLCFYVLCILITYSHSILIYIHCFNCIRYGDNTPHLESHPFGASFQTSSRDD